MDDLDRAKDVEIMQREQALQKALERPDHEIGEQQDMVDGICYCIDCGNEIDERRLKIKPESVRCVDCKEIWETNNPWL